MSFTPLRRSLFAVLFACAPMLHAAEPIGVAEFAAQLRDGREPLILDTRTPEEFAAGHIPGAKLVPHDRIDAALAELAPFKDQPIVLYCRSGRRSQLAEATLREHGFTDLAQLDGSWQAWEAAGLPVERDATTETSR